MRTLVRARGGPEYWKSWGELDTAVRTGRSGWELAHGMSWIEFYERHPSRWSDFNAHMSQHTKDAAPVRTQALVGFSLICPGWWDRPRLLLSRRKSGSGVRWSGETLFHRVLEGDDAYLMKVILHDWDGERASAILYFALARADPRLQRDCNTG